MILCEVTLWRLTDSQDITSPSKPSDATIENYKATLSYCYNCNKEIPENSKYCPWCQVELWVVCPICGNGYSSRYPACNQCGTNRKVYLREHERLKEERFEQQRRLEEKTHRWES